ncbi:hypothetical protein [Deinococcus multiflagellatus]|uniref:DUF676 domain-containing protein n=1 Tax=Deinococcus multiflagellatus TaxID=1656887 RepID=A0ABW1ZQS4_9DEIO
MTRSLTPALTLSALLLAGCASVAPLPTPAAQTAPAVSDALAAQPTPADATALQAQAVAPADFVLLIRGLEPFYSPSAHKDNSVTPAGCDTYFRDMIQYFYNQDALWGSKLRTVGFYDKQAPSSCYVNLKDVRPPKPYSSNLLLENRTFTNDTSIVQLGQRLAWWVYTNYTAKGYTVSLVGHSLGGLVARVAVGASGKDPRFPPPWR